MFGHTHIILVFVCMQYHSICQVFVIKTWSASCSTNVNLALPLNVQCGSVWVEDRNKKLIRLPTQHIQQCCVENGILQLLWQCSNYLLYLIISSVRRSIVKILANIFCLYLSGNCICCCKGTHSKFEHQIMMLFSLCNLNGCYSVLLLLFDHQTIIVDFSLLLCEAWNINY